MATVFFGHFGAKNHPSSHFSDHEQQLLKLAVDDAEYILSQALIAARHNFKGHHDKIKLWFGEVDPEQIAFVKRAVYNMHSTFTAPETFIKFIDGRSQYYRENMARLPLDNVTDVHYDELIMKGGSRGMVSPWTAAGVFLLSWPNSDDKYHTHAGSVMNIYICQGFFACDIDDKMRAKILLHEYSHKAICTVDYAVSIPDPNKADDCRFVLGEEECQLLATKNVLEAMKNADCWGRFLVSFTDKMDTVSNFTELVDAGTQKWKCTIS